MCPMPDHVYNLADTSSMEIRVIGKDGKCAGVAFVPEGESEGWLKLVPGGGSWDVVMGLLYVRVGPKLVSLPDEHAPEALNLDEAFPTYDELAAVRMEPPPDDDMSLGRVFSLAVSLCDVFRVRQFLVNGGSANTQVIIGRGINGTAIEALCANTPSSFKRKKMRIEFEGKSFARARSRSSSSPPPTTPLGAPRTTAGAAVSNTTAIAGAAVVPRFMTLHAIRGVGLASRGAAMV